MRGFTIQQNPHAAWTLAREQYARHGTEDCLRVLLRHVTMDNPPDAPGPRQHGSRNRKRIAAGAFLAATWAGLAVGGEVTNTTANKPGIAGAILLAGFLTLVLALGLKCATGGRWP